MISKSLNTLVKYRKTDKLKIMNFDAFEDPPKVPKSVFTKHYWNQDTILKILFYDPSKTSSLLKHTHINCSKI